MYHNWPAQRTDNIEFRRRRRMCPRNRPCIIPAQRIMQGASLLYLRRGWMFLRRCVLSIPMQPQLHFVLLCRLRRQRLCPRTRPCTMPAQRNMHGNRCHSVAPQTCMKRMADSIRKCVSDTFVAMDAGRGNHSMLAL